MAAALVAGLWTAFGSLRVPLHADAVLVALNGRVHWTPFFWGQHRFGMALPGLVRLLSTTMVGQLQLLLGLAAALVTFGTWQLARRLAGQRHDGAWIAALATAAVWGLASDTIRLELLLPLPYGVSFGLAMVGWAFAERGGWLGWGLALLATGIAHWVNPTTGLMLAPLLLMLAFMDAPPGAGRLRHALRTTDGRHALLLLLGCVAAMGEAAVRGGGEETGLVSGPLVLLQGLGELLSTAPNLTWLPPGVAAGLLLALLATALGFRRSPRPVAALLLLAGALHLLLLASSEWVRANQYATRYLEPLWPLFAVGLAFGLSTWLGLLRWLLPRASFLPPRQLRSAVLALPPLLGLYAAFGLPQRGLWEREAARQPAAARALELMGLGCTHYTDEYWHLWPTIFWSHVLADRAEGARPLFGVGVRCEDSSPAWDHADLPGLRVCGRTQEEVVRLAVHLRRSRLHASANGQWFVAE